MTPRSDAASIRVLQESSSDSDRLRIDHKYDFPHAAFPLLTFATVPVASRLAAPPSTTGPSDGVDLERVTDIRTGARPRRDEAGRPRRPDPFPATALGRSLADQVRAHLCRRRFTRRLE